MKSGLLWFYRGDVSENIIQALSRYKEKFGTNANMVYLSAQDAPGEKLTALQVEFKKRGVEIKTKQTIMSKHLFLGVIETAEEKNEAEPLSV